MRTSLILILLAPALVLLTSRVHAQEKRKVTFTGLGRSVFYGDDLRQDTPVPDTVTARKLHSGHVLVDVGVQIRPNANTEVLGMVRVRNDYGGFWGSGVTFDVRQLYVKGVIGNIIRYQLGDINYRMTRYTLWNPDQEVVSNMPLLFAQQADLLNYDHFYNFDQAWRQQGASAEFGLVFSKWIDELQVHAMTSRIAPADFVTTHDRLFSGLSISLIQSKYLRAGLNYANLYDVAGTSRNPVSFHNPVLTGTLHGEVPLKTIRLSIDAESGRSRTYYREDPQAPEITGQFTEASLTAVHEKTGIRITALAKMIDAQFRSPGAQTKRIRYDAAPIAYSRITNDQVLRPLNMVDLMRESTLCMMQLSPSLMQFAPRYDNITPYGDATPNRQGTVITLAYEKKDSPVRLEASRSDLQEMRGEGTLRARTFTRTDIRSELLVHALFADWKKHITLSGSMRSDQTNRPEEGRVQGVDLRTQLYSAGLEAEIFTHLDLLVGFQQITYQGAEFTAMRDEYSQIFNFSEYEVDGTETLTGAGIRYRFSDSAFVSTQWNSFRNNDQLAAVSPYTMNQLVWVFQMKF